MASTEAYTKALLHCFKYPTQQVMGMLVGKRLGAGADHKCYVTDVIPLFHTIPMTAPHPMLEVAYAHCQAAAKTRGLSLLGVYIANERNTDHSVPETARPLLLTLQARQPSGAQLVIWMVDNEAMTSPPTSLAITSVLYEGESTMANPVPQASKLPESERLSFARWNSDTLSPEATVPAEFAMESVTNALEAFAQFRLIDFEDHLENPQRNYLEQALADLMRK